MGCLRRYVSQGYFSGSARAGPRCVDAIPSEPKSAMTSEAMIVDRKTISIMKACELVGVSRRTIYNWIASGKVEYVRTAGGSVRIFVDTLWRKPEDASARHAVTSRATEQRRIS